MRRWKGRRQPRWQRSHRSWSSSPDCGCALRGACPYGMRRRIRRRVHDRLCRAFGSEAGDLRKRTYGLRFMTQPTDDLKSISQVYIHHSQFSHVLYIISLILQNTRQQHQPLWCSNTRQKYLKSFLRLLSLFFYWK
jgi:hypothetical protein